MKIKLTYLSAFLALVLSINAFAQKSSSYSQPTSFVAFPAAFYTFDAFQTFSTFRFSYKLNTESTQAGSPTYSDISSTGFGLGYESFYKSGLFVGGGLGSRKAGASMVYKKVDYLWNLQYIDFKATVGYQYDKWRIKPFVHLQPFFAYLLSAKQSIGLNYYDIKTDKNIKSYDFGAFASMGARVALTPYLSIYSNYTYNLSVKNIETTQGQYLYNRGFSFKLGLAFSPTNYKKMQDELNKQKLQFQDNNQAIDPNHFSSNNKTDNSQLYNDANQSQNNNNPGVDKISSPGTVGWGNSTAKSTNGNNSKTSNNQKNSNSSNNSNSDNTIQNTNISKSSTTNVSGNNTDVDNQNSTSNNNKAIAANTDRNAKKNDKTTDNAKTKNNTSSITADKFAGKGQTNIGSENNTLESETLTNNNTNKKSDTKNNKEVKDKTDNSKTKTNTKSDKNVKNIKKEEIIDEEMVVFKIQLTAVKNPLQSNHPIYKDKSFKANIQFEKGKDGWIRYFVGAFDSYEEAHAELNRLKTKNISEGGFVVAFKGGKKITVQEAKELVK